MSVMYVRMHVCTYVGMYVYLCICTYACVCTYIYFYVHTSASYHKLVRSNVFQAFIVSSIGQTLTGVRGHAQPVAGDFGAELAVCSTDTDVGNSRGYAKRRKARQASQSFQKY